VNRSAVLAPAARRDLRQAISRIASDNPAAARRLREAVGLALNRLGANPLVGAARPALTLERFRFLAVGRFPYLLVYTADTDPPRVLRLLHMARDIAAILAERR